ncbi:MAG: hypothetical protein M1824_001111 [Vezdaea acicularis]|nr:MAG: hypothetical protein M1824_001111 [Vezdaea acicularis]
MEQRGPPEYILEVFTDPLSAHDIVKGILHTIFFHRFFISIRPKFHEVLDLTLPEVDDVELETLIDHKAQDLITQIDTTLNTRSASVRGQIAVQFFEKRRRKAWFMKGDEEVCWEMWTLDVTLATPRTEAERIKVRKAMENQLQKTALKIVTLVNRDQSHIPPITTSDSNPFPYRIEINPKADGRGTRMGIFAT